MVKRRNPSPSASGTVTIPSSTGGTYVYRAYCRCDDLLYVGITFDLFGRLSSHRQNQAYRSEWEAKMVRLEWEIYRTRADAELVERRLIRELQPRFNRVHATGRRPIWRDLPAPRFLTEEELQGRAICAFKGRSFFDWLAERWDAA